MNVFKAVILFALIYITSASFSEQLGAYNDSAVVDYPVMVPQKVLEELINISDRTKGLQALFRYSRMLTDTNLLKAEVRSILHACSQSTVHADDSIASEIPFLL